MTLAYLDCFSGVSGDMTLGALVSLGVPVKWLQEHIAALPLSGFRLDAHDVTCNGLQAVRCNVRCTATPHHRSYGHIRDLLQKSPLPRTVRESSLAVFQRLAQAEAKIHGCPVQDVHFHEVGAVDALVDIVGSCLGLDYLGVQRVIVSPLPLGHGFVTCEHGVLPVPAPATLEILKGIPVLGGNQEQELVTPTGAALVAALASDFGPLPHLQIRQVGYGAGTRALVEQPNLLRIILGDPDGQRSPAGWETLVLVESCIDDMNPELFGYLMERLFADGALDVYWVPVYMKKNRPGTMVQVLCAPEKRLPIVERILGETTSLGVRFHEVQRTALLRETVLVQTAFGNIRVKQVTGLDGTIRIVPEYDTCKAIAHDRGLALRTVYDTIVSTAVVRTAADAGEDQKGRHH